MEDELWEILMALENNTRREMLKTLANDDSYALELSKLIGVSQQAINKQLDLLEKLGLISSAGMKISTIGPPRKVYKSSGFSTIIIDYSKNFMNIKKMDINYDNECSISGNNSELLDELETTNRNIDEINRKRSELIKTKDEIIEKLKNNLSKYDEFYRKIITDYIETLDTGAVAVNTGLPEEIIRHIVSAFISD